MKMMTVSEVSKAFNVSTRMLRYYEKIGLIESFRKEDYAYRIYDDTAVRRLQQIIILRKLRISLKQIAVILNDYEQLQALQIMQENISQLDEEITALNIIRDILSVFVSRLDESTRRKMHFDLFADNELIDIANALSLSKLNLKEEHSMSDLNNANEIIHKLTDREVRIVYLPPMTIAAIHTVSESPELENLKQLREFIKDKHLDQIKPDFRVLGFNNETPNCHGYEHWITIPENMDVPAPFVKKHFDGGLYGAYMIPMGAFEEWKWLYEWAQASNEYDIDWRLPERMMGGMFEEHLNFVNIYDNNMETLDKIMQLDLLVPIKKKA